MFLVTARGTPEDGVERVPWNLTRLTPAEEARHEVDTNEKAARPHTAAAFV